LQQLGLTIQSGSIPDFIYSLGFFKDGAVALGGSDIHKQPPNVPGVALFGNACLS
jgi:hypothetical protein